MDNIYETMWKDNKKWIENSITYYENLLRTYHPDVNRDYDRVADRYGTFQFMLDKLLKDESIQAESISKYELGSV